VFSGRGLCDGLTTRPQESYRLCCVVLCDLENLMNEETLAHWGGGLSRQKQTCQGNIESGYGVDCYGLVAGSFGL